MIFNQRFALTLSPLQPSALERLPDRKLQSQASPARPLALGQKHPSPQVRERDLSFVCHCERAARRTEQQSAVRRKPAWIAMSETATGNLRR
jgi:hypothetical protein